MIGENYPEKELLKNDRGLTPRGDNVVVVVPVLTACPLKGDERGSASGSRCEPQPGGARLFFFSSAWQAFYGK